MKELNNILNLVKQENWEQVDAILPQHSNTQEFLNWAKDNLDNEDPNLRDLAASILEISDTEISEQTITNLYTLMNEKDDNPYSAFRAACALAKRIENPEIASRANQIKNKLEEYLSDIDVSSIAQRYLLHINNR
jgi:hypothetical protein